MQPSPLADVITHCCIQVVQLDTKDIFVDSLGTAVDSGQKFIDFLSVSCFTGITVKNQQFLNSGTDLYHFSPKLWNIIGLGAAVMVQCP